MMLSTVAISLPIADRRASHRFYCRLLNREAIGTPAADGVPEPLQFALNDGTRLLMAPRGGFGLVIGDREVAPPGQSEVVLSLQAGSPADVDALVVRAREAGAAIVAEPAEQPWGYSGTFADLDGHVWMVTCAPLPG
jgi:predicted lactoylglutathione lyase